MGLKRYKQPRASRPLRQVVTNTAWGALGGAVIAGFALVVGVGRMVFALLSGRTMEAVSRSGVRLLAFYVGGFVLAGALVGMLRTFVTGTVGMFGAMALGGVVVTCTIAVADQGLDAMTRGDWIGMTVLGIIFGCAGAYGLTRA